LTVIECNTFGTIEHEFSTVIAAPAGFCQIQSLFPKMMAAHSRNYMWAGNKMFCIFILLICGYKELIVKKSSIPIATAHSRAFERPLMHLKNKKMKTQIIIPKLSISRYVSDILVIESYRKQRDFILPLYANGSPTLVFNTSKATSKNEDVAHLTLYGQTIKPGELSIKGDFTLIAYFLYPNVITSLFGIGANELTDKNLQLTFFDKAKTGNLQERLLNTPILNFRLELLNNFIQKLAENAIETNYKADYAIEKIRSSNGLWSLQNIQKELNITERTLQRLFETNIGISPKMYAKVCQFHTAIEQINRNQFLKQSDVAYANGYADQSHFIRVFKEFTSITPNTYLNNIKSISVGN
jgi:AraC-like DNA-binding protein